MLLSKFNVFYHVLVSPSSNLGGIFYIRALQNSGLFNLVEGLFEIREEYEQEDSSAIVLQPSGFNPGGEAEAG
ncbi:unnamed protein product [Brassica oleracea var. botrytis]